MEKATKLRVFRRALALIKHPEGWTRGEWVSSDEIVDGEAEEAYEVGRKKLAGSNTPKVRCCVQGGCYIAAGELGVSYGDAADLMEELDAFVEVATEGEYDSAIEVNDAEGQDAIVAVLEKTIKSIETTT